MTSVNTKPLNITIGSDARVMRAARIKEVFRPQAKEPGGYCGECRTHYEGNFTKHRCRV